MMRKWVLWGHRFSEYQDMFNCQMSWENKKVLEFACGPTTVNAELTAKGAHIISTDPFFFEDLAQTQQRFEDDFVKQMQHMQKYPNRFNFEQYGGMETFFNYRRQGFETFFLDYQAGLQSGRYQLAEGPKLPFENASFDIAFCSSFLFADFANQDLAFQLAWIKELARVAEDVRIYPLTNQLGEPSPLLGPVLLALQNENYRVSVQEVPFRLVPASNAMLQVVSGRCDLTI
jgi:hypothetical protein